MVTVVLGTSSEFPVTLANNIAESPVSVIYMRDSSIFGYDYYDGEVFDLD